MTFRKNRPPLVPDPGQQVELLAENGETLRGFRAVTPPLSYERGGIVVWVATEREYRESRREGRPAVSMPWPADKVTVRLPWWRLRRWTTS